MNKIYPIICYYIKNKCIMSKLNTFQECEFFLILKSMETTHYTNKLKEKNGIRPLINCGKTEET